ncbi:hypothetical protein [Rhodopseudomonas palustris]|uniref:hypothetical protein n=1 Tax=Rhodopseudomonas palustris TaxID=1076 RepID=UPI000E5B2F16|nr:hypothetical protein [Rhodopseudomonas palustris]QLH73465.1 hypothetical protein HZF03_22735 [Rhodopseudomonas palustris]RIA02870.1 hypothetical protein D1920_05255 [Rhodopseudomonas palustris]
MSGLLSYLPNWHETFEQIKDAATSVRTVLESNFTTSLVGSLAGAFGGAWAAQKIAEKSKLRDELMREIRQTNAASSMVYGVANAHLGLKRQFVKELKDTYDKEQQKFANFLAQRASGAIPANQPYVLSVDLQTIKPLLSPVTEIKELVFDRISLTGPSLLLVPVLLSSIQALTESMEGRNKLSDDWRASNPPNIVELYLGVPQGGVVDRRYQMLIESIYRQTDDVIAFSTMIGEDLYGHAIELRKQLRNKCKVEGPLVSTVDLSRFKDIMPPDSEYENFRTMYKDWKNARPTKIPMLKRLFRKKTFGAENVKGGGPKAAQ